MRSPKKNIRHLSPQQTGTTFRILANIRRLFQPFPTGRLISNYWTRYKRHASSIVYNTYKMFVAITQLVFHNPSVSRPIYHANGNRTISFQPTSDPVHPFCFHIILRILRTATLHVPMMRITKQTHQVPKSPKKPAKEAKVWQALRWPLHPFRRLR